MRTGNKSIQSSSSGANNRKISRKISKSFSNSKNKGIGDIPITQSEEQVKYKFEKVRKGKNSIQSSNSVPNKRISRKISKSFSNKPIKI